MEREVRGLEPDEGPLHLVLDRVDIIGVLIHKTR
jgi:hypothetical protein